MRIVRSRPLLLAFCLVLIGLAPSCGDDGPSGPSAQLDVDDLEAQLVLLAYGDEVSTQTSKSIRDLSTKIAFVMAAKGVPNPPSPQVLARAPGLFDYLIPAAADRDDTAAHASPFAMALAAPRVLGGTCIWNFDTDLWKGTTAIYGPVPGDGTRFEMYDNTMPDRPDPGMPLQPLGTWIDVRPLVQASQTVTTCTAGQVCSTTSGNVNLVLQAGQQGGTSVMDVLLAGQSNDDSGVFDLIMTGDVRAGSNNLLEFLFTSTNQRSANVVNVQDITMLATVDARTLRALLLIQKRNDPRQSIEFDMVLSSGSTIATGDVYISNQLVATMRGARLEPTFTLESSRFDDTDQLALIYGAALAIDSRMNELFLFGYCVGTDGVNACTTMDQLLVGN